MTPWFSASYRSSFSARVQGEVLTARLYSSLSAPRSATLDRERERQSEKVVTSSLLRNPSLPLLFRTSLFSFFFSQYFCAAHSGSMPVFILLRSLVIRLLSSRLAGSLAQFLRRSLSTGAAHLGTALRRIWDHVRSQESKEAILGCVLCILNMHKKVEN